MTSLKASDLFVPLKRPEYPASPEIFLTSLAWRKFGFQGVKKDFRLRYMKQHKVSEGKVKRQKVQYSFDFLTDVSSDLGQRLAANGFSTGNSNGESYVSREFVDAVLLGISGTSSVHSDYTAASPMTPMLAMLQTVVGMKGTDSNFAGIMSDVASLGGLEEDLSESWIRASSQIMSANPHLDAIDRSIEESLKFGERTHSSNPTSLRQWKVFEENPELAKTTPFSWFARSWSNLVNDSWTQSLPPRLWTDWANAIMRTGFGMAYLWEAAWYHGVARIILDSSRDFKSFDSFIGVELIPWLTSDVSVTLRGVRGQLEQRVKSGSEISRILRGFCDSNQLMDSAVEDLLARAREDSVFMRELENVIHRPTKRHKSTSEAIFYSLNTRREDGDGADYYGLLRLQSRKFLVPNPGTEWIAAITSLVSASSGRTINLGQLLEELSSIGLHPPVRELVNLLEQSGLARGSADSDSGMEIGTAF